MFSMFSTKKNTDNDFSEPAKTRICLKCNIEYHGQRLMCDKCIDNDKKDDEVNEETNEQDKDNEDNVEDNEDNVEDTDDEELFEPARTRSCLKCNTEYHGQRIVCDKCYAKSTNPTNNEEDTDEEDSDSDELFEPARTRNCLRCNTEYHGQRIVCDKCYAKSTTPVEKKEDKELEISSDSYDYCKEIFNFNETSDKCYKCKINEGDIAISNSGLRICFSCDTKANGYEPPKIKLTIKQGSNVIINTFGYMTIEIDTKK